jgi:predicted DNA-binding transcriptional regulator AlpA
MTTIAPTATQTMFCDSFLRLRDVLHRVGVSRSSWLSWVKRGAAPKPVRLGPAGHLLAWRAADLQRWMDEQTSRPNLVEPSRYPFGRERCKAPTN